MRRFILLLATNGGLGNAPLASGTVGTLAGLPVYYLLASLPLPAYGLIWLALLLLSFWVAHRAGQYYGVVDDGRIVIDELVGYLIAVAGHPFSWTAALLGFVLFRIFDVSKVPPANWFDRRMKNGVGVVLDDVVAGLYAAAALYFCLPWVQSLLERQS